MCLLILCPIKISIKRLIGSTFGVQRGALLIRTATFFKINYLLKQGIAISAYSVHKHLVHNSDCD